MVLEIFKDSNDMLRVLPCLSQLGELAYSIRQDMDAKVQTPVLEDGTNLWEIPWLNSKTMNLYGSLNEDKRRRFKIDHDFDLSMIVGASVNPDGDISIDESAYLQSKGTEFIIIDQKDLKGEIIKFYLTKSYAIGADKYGNIKEQLNKGKCTLVDLEKAGGFKINTLLTPSEVLSHDGWLELAVGRNNATKEDYAEAVKFLKEKYVPEAKKNNCFKYDHFKYLKGMGFDVQINQDNFSVRPWSIWNSDVGSDADDKNGFSFISVYFLRTRDSAAAEGNGKNLN